jgi:hypothetical protein
MSFKRPLLGLLLSIALYGGNARADYWEFSAGLNYSKSTYTGQSYTWNRRLGASVGYNFSDSSTIELAYQKSFERDHYEGFEDSFYDDQVYSVNLVWNILGRGARIQPYAKVGIGELNRVAAVYDSIGRSQIENLDQVTGVIGVGVKFFVTKTIALRLEGTSYLANGRIKTWQDNFGATFGVSLYY